MLRAMLKVMQKDMLRAMPRAMPKAILVDMQAKGQNRALRGLELRALTGSQKG